MDMPSETSASPLLAGHEVHPHQRPKLHHHHTAPAESPSPLSLPDESQCPSAFHRVSDFHTLSAQAEEKMWWVQVSVVVVYFAIGLMLGYHEGWSLCFAAYFSVETLTTVGYGDFKFKDTSPNFQLAVGIFVLLGVLVMAAALTEIFKHAYETQRRRIEKLVSERHRKHQQQHHGKECPLSRRRFGRSGHLGEAGQLYRHALEGLRTDLYQCMVVFLGILALGATIVGYIEDWDWRKSFYWACVTFTSVGYGDVVPDSQVSRIATMVLMLVGVLVIGSCAGFFGSYTSLKREARLREEVLTQFGTKLTGEELESLVHGNEVRRLDITAADACMSRSEFVLFMLVKLGRVEEEELQACQVAFDCLNVSGSGTLTKEDLEMHDAVRAHRQLR